MNKKIFKTITIIGKKQTVEESINEIQKNDENWYVINEKINPKNNEELIVRLIKIM